MVKLEDAVEIISALENAGIKVFIDGGWGVDALLGYQSRTHNDIDIFIEQQMSWLITCWKRKPSQAKNLWIF